MYIIFYTRLYPSLSFSLLHTHRHTHIFNNTMSSWVRCGVTGKITWLHTFSLKNSWFAVFSFLKPWFILIWCSMSCTIASKRLFEDDYELYPLHNQHTGSRRLHTDIQFSDSRKALQTEVVSTVMLRLTAAPRELIQMFQAPWKK